MTMNRETRSDFAYLIVGAVMALISSLFYVHLPENDLTIILQIIFGLAATAGVALVATSVTKELRRMRRANSTRRRAALIKQKRGAQ